MVRRKTTLRCKSGGVQNGNGAGHPRTLLELTTYYEAKNRANWTDVATHSPFFDAQYGGLSNPTRPKNYALSLRRFAPGH